MNANPTSRVCLLSLITLFFAGVTSTGSYVSLVKVYGYDGEYEEVAMSQEEMNELRAEISEEARYHMPAVMLAKQNWKAAGEDGTYPRTAVSRRRFIKTNRFDSKSEAEAYMDRRQASKEKFQAQKEERKKLSQSKSGSSRCPITGKKYSTSKGNKSYASSSKRDKEREQKREASRAKRDARDAKAIDYYLEAMTEVRQKEQARLQKVAEENALVQERLRQM